MTLMVDNLGRAGRAFGVGTGWRPDDKDMSPYVKLFGMLFGLGVSKETRFSFFLPDIVYRTTFFMCQN